ncbi:MAG: hypothetical protein ABSF50_19625 [Burkholderiaceae bacterium]
MDLALLFFLPLLGGFLFVVDFYGTRFKVARQETQRVYYKAAFCGVVLSIVGLVLHHQFQRQSDTYRDIAVFLRQHFVDPLLERPIPAGGPAPSADSIAARDELAFACLWGFFLGAAAPLYNVLIMVVDWAWTYLFARWVGLPSLRQMINRSSIRDQFELLITDALIQANQVQVTLVNQKVYTGWVTQSVNPESQEKYIRLQPSLSGYRSKDTCQVEFTTNYGKFLEKETDKRKLRSFEVVIPIDKVISASGFDPKAYKALHHSAEEAQAPHEEPSKHDALLSGELTVHLVRPTKPPPNPPAIPVPGATQKPAAPGSPPIDAG